MIIPNVMLQMEESFLHNHIIETMLFVFEVVLVDITLHITTWQALQLIFKLD